MVVYPVKNTWAKLMEELKVINRIKLWI